jgi:hypothetical protein
MQLDLVTHGQAGPEAVVLGLFHVPPTGTAALLGFNRSNRVGRTLRFVPVLDLQRRGLVVRAVVVSGRRIGEFSSSSRSDHEHALAWAFEEATPLPVVKLVLNLNSVDTVDRGVPAAGSIGRCSN